jgi:hypothetical protein
MTSQRTLPIRQHSLRQAKHASIDIVLGEIDR